MYRISIQQHIKKVYVPSTTHLRRWARKALQSQIDAAEVALSIIDEEAMAELNTTYRHKKGPTNVLSFPMQWPEVMPSSTPMLGDIAICAEVVNKEAKEQGKTRDAHWAHMVVHGILHLLGFDHVKKAEAEIMETLEADILQTLGFAHPYHTEK